MTKIIYSLFFILSISSAYCMKQTEKSLPQIKNNQTTESPQSPTSGSIYQPTRHKSVPKTPIKSHAQLIEEVKTITTKHRQTSSESSCSTSEKRG